MSVAPSTAPATGNAPQDPSPDYLTELWLEVRSFLLTLWELSKHPIAFHREWVGGRQEAMNPIAFFGVCFGLAEGISLVQFHATKTTEPTHEWWVELAGANLALAGCLFYGLIAYSVLRRRKSGASLRATLGVICFSTAAANLVASVIDDLIRVACFRLHLEFPKTPVELGQLALLFVWVNLALSGASGRGILAAFEATLSPLAALPAMLFLLILAVLAGKLLISTNSDAAARLSARKALLRPSALARWDQQNSSAQPTLQVYANLAAAADAGTIAQALPAIDAGARTSK